MFYLGGYHFMLKSFYFSKIIAQAYPLGSSLLDNWYPPVLTYCFQGTHHESLQNMCDKLESTIFEYMHQ